MAEWIDHQLCKHDQFPTELLRLQTLKDKVKHICSTSGKGLPGQKQPIGDAVASRKRPYISNSESDSSDASPPQATSQLDLPGLRSPKCRKLFDPNLIINLVTPSKSVEVCPTSSKYLQNSASKVLIPGKILSDPLLDTTVAGLLAQNINDSVNKSNIPLAQAPEKADEIIDINPTLSDLIQRLQDSFEWQQSSSGESHYQSENDEISAAATAGVSQTSTENRELETPVPKVQTGRYHLRSTNRSSSALNVSGESKRSKSEKPEILSNVRVNVLPESALQIRNDPIVLSDSDSDRVTTTSQTSVQQPQFHTQLASQPTVVGYNVNQSGQLMFLISQMPNVAEIDDTQHQPPTSTIENQYNLPAINSVIGPSQFTVPVNQQIYTISSVENCAIDGSQPEQTIGSIAPNQDGKRDRIIVINDDDINKEGEHPEPAKTSDNAIEEPKTQSHDQAFQQTKEKQNIVEQLKQIEQKVVTPKQLIRPNIIPGSSRSLSTPRNKNPHVRVLDFNTPARKLFGISENKNESFANETPHNRSIMSTGLPSSAPPKVNSAVIQSRRISNENESPATAEETFIPVDENTLCSADGETPKVRRGKRKVNKKRLQLAAATKRKKPICTDEADSNGSKASEKKEEKNAPKEQDAMAEWQKIRSASTNPVLFEQNLREENSKKQETEDLLNGRKKRSRKAKKKPAASKVEPAKHDPDDTNKSNDISMNSSIDTDILNSTATNLEARMLEENLKSAKKETPHKQFFHKSAKKMTPIKIKLMPSPKNKALKRAKNANTVKSTSETTKDEIGASKSQSKKSDEVPMEIEAATEEKKVENQSIDKVLMLASENTTDDLEVAQNLINMQNVILQQENERKRCQSSENQKEIVPVSSTAPVIVVSAPAATVATVAEPPADSVVFKSVMHSALSMSTLLETPFKDPGEMFPRTPGLNCIMPQLTTP